MLRLKASTDWPRLSKERRQGNVAFEIEKMKSELRVAQRTFLADTELPSTVSG